MQGCCLSQLKWSAFSLLSHIWTPFGLSSYGCSASLGLDSPVLTLSSTKAMDVSRALGKSASDFLLVAVNQVVCANWHDGSSGRYPSQ